MDKKKWHARLRMSFFCCIFAAVLAILSEALRDDKYQNETILEHSIVRFVGSTANSTGGLLFHPS